MLPSPHLPPFHLSVRQRSHQMPDSYEVGPGNSWGRHTQLPLFQDWPPSPRTARLGQPLTKPSEDHLPGLGDIDCDMLADADEYGIARAPAKEEIRRRAAREFGIQSHYHEGFCLAAAYGDPRSDERKDAEQREREAGLQEGKIVPDWSDPFEVVEWKDDPVLRDFETTLYGFGFEPILHD